MAEEDLILTGELVGHINPVGVVPAFSLPIFKPFPQANSHYIQDISPNGTVAAFRLFFEPGITIAEVERPLKLAVGDPAVYVFARRDGTISGSRAWVAEQLKRDLQSLTEWPTLALRVAEFCGLKQLDQYRQNAFAHIGRVFSGKDAIFWRNHSILLPTFRGSIEKFVIGGRLPAEIYECFSDLHLDVHGREIQITISEAMEEILSSSQITLSELTGECVQAARPFGPTKARLMSVAAGMQPVREDRLLRKLPRDEAATPIRRLIIGVGAASQAALKALGQSAPAQFGQFPPEQKWLSEASARIGRLTETLVIGLAAKEANRVEVPDSGILKDVSLVAIVFDPTSAESAFVSHVARSFKQTGARVVAAPLRPRRVLAGRRLSPIMRSTFDLFLDPANALAPTAKKRQSATRRFAMLIETGIEILSDEFVHSWMAERNSRDGPIWISVSRGKGPTLVEAMRKARKNLVSESLVEPSSVRSLLRLKMKKAPDNQTVSAIEQAFSSVEAPRIHFAASDSNSKPEVTIIAEHLSQGRDAAAIYQTFCIELLKRQGWEVAPEHQNWGWQGFRVRKGSIALHIHCNADPRGSWRGLREPTSPGVHVLMIADRPKRADEVEARIRGYRIISYEDVGRIEALFDGSVEKELQHVEDFLELAPQRMADLLFDPVSKFVAREIIRDPTRFDLWYPIKEYLMNPRIEDVALDVIEVERFRKSLQISGEITLEVGHWANGRRSSTTFNGNIHVLFNDEGMSLELATADVPDDLWDE